MREGAGGRLLPLHSRGLVTGRTPHRHRAAFQNDLVSTGPELTEATRLHKARRRGGSRSSTSSGRAAGEPAGLRAAVEALDRSPARLEHARALTDLGAALRRANRRAEARGELEKALVLAERCGARPLADRARTELRAAGGPVSDPLSTGVEQLTVSERRPRSRPRAAATPRSRRRCS
jgi:hypothetical protein